MLTFQAITSVKRNGCGIKGNIESRINQPHIASRNVEMRNALDLYFNVVHCKSVEGIKTRHDNIDVVVVRQNTAGKASNFLLLNFLWILIVSCHCKSSNDISQNV